MGLDLDLDLDQDLSLPSASAGGAQNASRLARSQHRVRTHLCPKDITRNRPSSKSLESPALLDAFQVVVEAGKAGMVFEDFLYDVEDQFHLVWSDVGRYVKGLDESNAVSVVPQTNTLMTELLDRLALWQRAWGTPLRPFGDPKFIPTFTSSFHQLLHASLPPSFPAHLTDFLFTSLANIPASTDTSSASVHAVVPTSRRIPPPSAHLTRLGFTTRYSATLTRVAYAEIERVARDEAGKGWDERRLGRARQRVSDGVVNWIAGLFEGNEYAQNVLRPMYLRFDYYLCKCFFDIRTDELFDIIVDYPDSLAALEDLKDCLNKVDQRSVLVDKLRASNIKRLLHPGAETKDVITQYISTIRCLRILDPPGVLLHGVAEPIRRHLRDRPDTIRCIVTTLVEGEELQDENEPNAEMVVSGNDENVENFTDPKWEPEPVDAAPEFRSGRARDIVSTLVSIYESQEVIIKELQVLLASRLLAVKGYDNVREIRIIELLKLRFGEAALQGCDVMLKDVADSKRINDHIHGDIQSVVNPLVISRMYWPDVPSSALHLPPKLQKAQVEYEAAFHRFKPDKHLRWLQSYGTVDLSLTLDDGRVIEVTADPIQASVVELFEEADVWTAGDISKRLGGVGVGVVRGALGFWADHGVVKEIVGGLWRAIG